MAALQFADARGLAAKRFPRSRRTIFGDGYWALCLCCVTPWRILLYRTEADRDAGHSLYTRMSCPGGRCIQDHILVDLWPTPPVKFKPARENGMIDFGEAETR